MVVTEAMASALPVIVSREAGAAELLEHGINGLVLNDFQNVDELAELMHSLANDRAFARRLGHAGRITAEQYSWDVVAGRTMEIYRRACQSHSAASVASGASTVESAAEMPAPKNSVKRTSVLRFGRKLDDHYARKAETRG